jgi:hypothetical protein
MTRRARAAVVLACAAVAALLGWGEGATHTSQAGSPLADIPAGPLDLPLRHPDAFVPFREADELTESEQYSR